jgi:hypothetical protein
MVYGLFLKFSGDWDSRNHGENPLIGEQFPASTHTSHGCGGHLSLRVRGLTDSYKHVCALGGVIPALSPQYHRLAVGSRVEVVTIDRLKPHMAAGPMKAAQTSCRGQPRVQQGRSTNRGCGLHYANLGSSGPARLQTASSVFSLNSSGLEVVGGAM